MNVVEIVALISAGEGLIPWTRVTWFLVL